MSAGTCTSCAGLSGYISQAPLNECPQRPNMLYMRTPFPRMKFRNRRIKIYNFFSSSYDPPEPTSQRTILRILTALLAAEQVLFCPINLRKWSLMMQIIKEGRRSCLGITPSLYGLSAYGKKHCPVVAGAPSPTFTVAWCGVNE